jgi:hypothetical protein
MRMNQSRPTNDYPRKTATVKLARVPEWVRRAQLNQLVRKDMTGMVSA